MFHNISPAMRERMAYLEAIDARDRVDDTPKSRRLRQVPPETGRFLALLAAVAPQGQVVEIGTSGGYSGLWLAMACRERGDRLDTFDPDPAKALRAQETFKAAGMSQWVQVIQADARAELQKYAQIAFCFLDAEKDIYRDCFALVVPRLVAGGIFVADNLISHHEELAAFQEQALADPRVDALVVPIGKGLLVCRRPEKSETDGFGAGGI